MRGVEFIRKEDENMARIAINGFGRIGRNAFKIGMEKGLDIVAINDLTDAQTLAHLLRYDSCFGKYAGTVEVRGKDLVVNGKLMITPDAAEVLQKYACILVNGMIYCPQCLSAVVSARCILNGKLAVYPDDAVLLPGSSIKLDNTFLLRAQSRLYWNEHRFLAVDPRLDTAALAAKGCSFSAPKAILCASLAPVLAPLFPDSTELIIVPDGTAVVEDWEGRGLSCRI